ncbi:MAG: hypothetical protein AAFN77_18005 [Planctomycetota bacterium]
MSKSNSSKLQFSIRNLMDGLCGAGFLIGSFIRGNHWLGPIFGGMMVMIGIILLAMLWVVRKWSFKLGHRFMVWAMFLVFIVFLASPAYIIPGIDVAIQTYRVRESVKHEWDNLRNTHPRYSEIRLEMTRFSDVVLVELTGPVEGQDDFRTLTELVGECSFSRSKYCRVFISVNGIDDHRRYIVDDGALFIEQLR